MMPESGDRAERIATFAEYGYIVKAPVYNREALWGRMAMTDCAHYQPNNKCDCLTRMWCKADECSFYRQRGETDGREQED